MKTRIYLLLVVLINVLLIQGCEEESGWAPGTGGSVKMVVEACITSEFKTQQVKLSTTTLSPNDIPDGVSSAQVIISTRDSVYLFKEDSARPGIYLSDRKFSGKAGAEYSLFISTGGSIISAKATMPPVTDFRFLTYSPSGDNGYYKITWVAETYSNWEPAMYEIIIGQPDDSQVKLYYYTLPSLDIHQVFPPRMEQTEFKKGTVITERKYSLSAEHAAYIRALLSETGFSGGFYTTMPANVPTNLSNGALGFFSASEVIEKTNIVE